MRHVIWDVTVLSEAVEDVFNAVLRWELPDPEDGGGPSWEWDARPSAGPAAAASGIRPRWLEFRSGLLRWNEHISSFRDDLEIHFSLVDGDFADFSGKWVMRQNGDDVRLHFEVDFGFGIPSMEGILDPVAEQAITETIERAVTGMFERLRLPGGSRLPDGTGDGIGVPRSPHGPRALR